MDKFVELLNETADFNHNLHNAVCNGQQDDVQLLLDNGASINTVDENGCTVLHQALSRGYEAIAQLLINRGADVAAKRGNDKMTALHLAAAAGYEMSVPLLLENGADLEAKDDKGLTALHFAAFIGHETIVRLLLDNGADLEAKNDNALTALHVAAVIGHETIVRLLLDNGADLEAKNNNGWRALYFAAWAGHENIVRLLFERGTDLSDVFRNGHQLALLLLRSEQEQIQTSGLVSRQYIPLDQEKREIRLLSILPTTNSSDSERVNCTIEQVSLDDKPEYIALSYVWGDAKTTLPIAVNGKEKQVTTNLESALRHTLKFSTPGSRFWVDAICINQKDKDERNHQVKLMRDIYSGASKVLIWLGEEEYQAMDIIEDWIRHLNTLLGRSTGAQGQHGLLDGPLDRAETIHRLNILSQQGNLQEMLGPFLNLENLATLNRFFSLPWWSRVWTFQEVVLGRAVIVLCGLKMLPWNYLRDFHLLSSTVGSALSTIAMDSDDATIAETALSTQKGSLGARATYKEVYNSLDRWIDSNDYRLFALLHLPNEVQATDPLDYVFGLLGLAEDREHFEEFISYSQSPAELYTKIALRWIELDGNLNFLSHSGISQPRKPEMCEKLPSWIPNWAESHSPLFRGFETRLFSAGGGEGVKPEISFESPQCLRARGYSGGIVSHVEPFGMVRAASEPFETSQAASGTGQSTSFILQNWTFNDTGFPSTLAALQQYFRTTMLDMDPITKTRLSPSNSSFYDFFSAAFWIWRLVARLGSEFSANFSSLLEVLEGLSEIGDGDRGQDADQLLVLFRLLNPEAAWLEDLDIFRRGRRNFGGVVSHWLWRDRMAFFLTEDNRMGMGPLEMNERDIIAVLLGHPVPVVLRKVEDHYLFVGECFVYGIMDGEIIRDGGAEERQFNIH